MRESAGKSGEWGVTCEPLFLTESSKSPAWLRGATSSGRIANSCFDTDLVHRYLRNDALGRKEYNYGGKTGIGLCRTRVTLPDLLCCNCFICRIWCGFCLVLGGGRHRLPSLQTAVHHGALHPQGITVWAVRIILALLVTGFITAGAAATWIIGAMTAKAPQNLDYVIVLGAHVRGTVPSRALRKRLDCAKAYAEENPDTIFFLSGGQGSGEDITEAEAMYRYLTE